MSSTNSGTGSVGDQGGVVNVQFALTVVAVVLGFIISLLFLRFFCNVAIDLCILCDPYEARRTAIEFRDRYFPCFKRRLVVPARRSQTTPRRGQESAQSTRNRTAMSDVDTLLASLPEQLRQRVLESLLTGKSAQTKDLTQHGIMNPDRDGRDIESSGRSEEGSHSERFVRGCSICLVDFEIGSVVFVSPPCRHVFHRSCILEWCNGNNTACPYCRQPMISEPQVLSTIAGFPTSV